MQATRSEQTGAHARGVTLVELMVVVAIVGILAAIAIPAFSVFIKEGNLSEAISNIQGILVAEQAFMVNQDHYTVSLDKCPQKAADPGVAQVWPGPAALPGDCPGWEDLGWRPDGPVRFQYRVFTSVSIPLPQNLPAGGWGVNWTGEGFNNPNPLVPPPDYCAVEAWADTDDNKIPVVFRSNSYNQKIFRNPESGEW